MISVVIPVFNEEEHIQATVRRLYEHDRSKLINEIVIVDGGSTDLTIDRVKTERVRLLESPVKGRAAQMNAGASAASGDVLYFLHADTIPPPGFSQDIKEAIAKGFDAGCYRLSFDHKHWFLKANAWFTRFDIDAIRFGDQSLFIRKDKFIETGGFCEKHIVMEDQEFINRIKKDNRFTIVQKPVLTSARKYLDNGIYKTQFIFILIFFMYKAGIPQYKLLAAYRKFLNQDKL